MQAGGSIGSARNMVTIGLVSCVCICFCHQTCLRSPFTRRLIAHDHYLQLNFLSIHDTQCQSAVSVCRAD